MKQIIIPVGRKILIKQDEALSVYPGTTIIIPDSAKKKQFTGVVVGVGKLETEISVGDRVQYADYTVPTVMYHEDTEHLLINAGDVIAIIQNV